MKKKEIKRRKEVRKEMRIGARVPEELFLKVKKYADDHYTKVSQLIIDTLVERIEKKQGQKLSDKTDLPAS